MIEASTVSRKRINKATTLKISSMLTMLMGQLADNGIGGPLGSPDPGSGLACV